MQDFGPNGICGRWKERADRLAKAAVRKARRKSSLTKAQFNERNINNNMMNAIVFSII